MHTAIVALGANLPGPAGEPADTLVAAIVRLESPGHVTACSSLYSTTPVGVAEQPRFLNAVAVLETELEPLDLLHTLLAIEKEFGRDRSAKIANGPRTLDLDLLLYENRILDLPELQLPHPRLAERAFVLIPLAEIAPEVIDPRSGKSAAVLLTDLRHDAPSVPDSVLKLEDGWPF